MRLIAQAQISRANPSRIERLSAGDVAHASAVIKHHPTSRFILAEDLEYLYRTGQSRQTLILRWTR